MNFYLLPLLFVGLFEGYGTFLIKLQNIVNVVLHKDAITTSNSNLSISVVIKVWDYCCVPDSVLVSGTHSYRYEDVLLEKLRYSAVPVFLVWIFIYDFILLGLPQQDGQSIFCLSGMFYFLLFRFSWLLLVSILNFFGIGQCAFRALASVLCYVWVVFWIWCDWGFCGLSLHLCATTSIQSRYILLPL